MSKNKPEYVQLEANDDVTAVRDRLSFLRGKHVLIIWPEKGTALNRKLDLVLVQREAKRRAIRLALVTHDEQVMTHAKDLGISTFETVRASQRGRWKRGRTKVFTQRYHKPEDEPEPEELMEHASRVKRPRRKISQLRYVTERLIILAILLAVIGITAYVALPSATVTLSLSQELISIENTIIADPTIQDINIEEGRIPATVFQATVETTGTVPTTGIQNVANSTAQGTVIFTNQTASAVDIPANTTLSTSAGTPILFKTLADVTVPAGVGERVEAQVEAMQNSAGGVGNVDTGLINTIIGPLEDAVTVRNLAPTSGGENRTIQVVTDEDRNSLLNTVNQQLQALAYEEMQLNLSDVQYIVIETIQIAEERNDWTTYSHHVGDLASQLSLTKRVVVEAVVLDDRFGEQITLANLSADIPPGRIIQDSPIYVRGPIVDIGENNQITFTASGSTLIIGQLDANQLAERIASLSLDEARELILTTTDISPGTQPTITITPDWFGQMPILPVRINIEIVQPQ